MDCFRFDVLIVAGMKSTRCVETGERMHQEVTLPSSLLTVTMVLV